MECISRILAHIHQVRGLEVVVANLLVVGGIVLPEAHTGVPCTSAAVFKEPHAGDVGSPVVELVAFCIHRIESIQGSGELGDVHPVLVVDVGLVDEEAHPGPAFVQIGDGDVGLDVQTGIGHGPAVAERTHLASLLRRVGAVEVDGDGEELVPQLGLAGHHGVVLHVARVGTHHEQAFGEVALILVVAEVVPPVHMAV